MALGAVEGVVEDPIGMLMQPFLGVVIPEGGGPELSSSRVSHHFSGEWDTGVATDGAGVLVEIAES